MINKILFCLFAFLLGAINIGAQESFTETLVLDLPEKAAVSFEPQAASPDSVISGLENLRQQASSATGNVVHRFLIDAKNGVVFGYQLKAEALGENRFRLSLAPLAESAVPPLVFKPNSLSARRKLTFLTLPQTFANQVLADGDALAVDLLVHPQLNVKISDKIRVSADKQKLEPPSRVPRNFTLDDIEIAVKNLKMRVANKDLPTGKSVKTYSGSLLWLQVPEKGFLMLSLVPREGYDFQKVGIVRDNKITFQLKHETYELISEQQIVPVGGTWFLWVMHKPDYKAPVLETMAEYESQKTNIRQTPKKHARIAVNKKDGAITGTIGIEIKDRNDKIGFGKPTKEDAEETQTAETKPLPTVRFGAVKQVQNIFLNN